MKNPSHPPPKSDAKPVSAKRQKILDSAMAQLRKTRAQMDPKVLGKIRSLIAGNPKIMKRLGIDSVPPEQGVGKPQSQMPKEKEVKPQPIRREPAQPKVEGKGAEKVDQAKNMEVVAKLMALKPSEIENIKAVLLKDKD